jgi:uncharacterized protein (DUF433 family)
VRAQILSIETIVSAPDIRAGRPVIIGTGVRVSDVAALSVFHGRTPDQIAVSYGLTLGQVYAALAYYHDHQAVIDAEIQEYDEVIQRAKDQSHG